MSYFHSPFDDELGGERIKVSTFSSFQIRTPSALPPSSSQTRISHAIFSESVPSGGYLGTQHVRVRNRKNTLFNMLKVLSHLDMGVCSQVALFFSCEVVASFGRS